jgi:hypothetical protein
MRSVKIECPKGRSRELLAYGSVAICDQDNPEIPKDGVEEVTVTFCFGRGGKTRVTVLALASWEENRYPSEYGGVDSPCFMQKEDGARVDLDTRELVVPNKYVAYFEPHVLA